MNALGLITLKLERSYTTGRRTGGKRRPKLFLPFFCRELCGHLQPAQTFQGRHNPENTQSPRKPFKDTPLATLNYGGGQKKRGRIGKKSVMPSATPQHTMRMTRHFTKRPPATALSLYRSRLSLYRQGGGRWHFCGMTGHLTL